MKALIFEEIEKVTVDNVKEPKLEEPTDIVLKVETAAICGSDLHPYRGTETGLDPGTVMGHEAVGVVVEVGRNVTRLRAGDRVFLPFTVNCGNCWACLSGLTCRCEKSQLFGWRSKGKGLHGLQAEYARVPFADATAIKLPSGLDPEVALFLCDIFPTGYFSTELGNVNKGSKCVVVGCGPVGLLAVFSARLRGAETVFAVDSVPERLKVAERLGAIPLLLGTNDIHHQVLQQTHLRGADVVIEAVGNSAAQKLGYELVRPGGILATVGVHSSLHFSFSPSDAYDKNLTYRTGRCPARRLAEELLSVSIDHASTLKGLVTHRLPLEKGPEGYRMFAARREGCVKVILAV